VTTLVVKALAGDPQNPLSEEQKNKLREHLLGQQVRKVHPFNGAEPGGWGWTSTSGAVPDADDTPGAILALHALYTGTHREEEALIMGCRWLTGLQNSDGGFPTFCRGWGKLPFDKSCADLTGHALLALIRTQNRLGNTIDRATRTKMDQSILKAICYLETHQHADGSWIPLWFGNQRTDDQTNPVYGTARVCAYLHDSMKCLSSAHPFTGRLKPMVQKAEAFLTSQQNQDGSWGGKKGVQGTIEETALAVAALALNHPEPCEKGILWIQHQPSLKSSPIGLYFALLWYDEKMYPLVCYTEALRKMKSSIQ
jgi:squalene-hopene/tetraprenyl-beta-curcumene cyclase